ncbi:ectopic P granules protein 5 homolog [Solea solea]|uniref:ectopic P granules protein 5 homolog n=1 Tax=Solea solea TaxID=90069 RepID=UPI00272CD68D|nr:ectopic P granules protein 5 homolog [Solea solea]
MEAVRPKRTKAKTVGKSQSARKQKQAEEEKRATAPSAVSDEASESGFTDIPLSLPYQEPEEEQQDHAQPPQTPAQLSDLSSEKQKTSSSQTLSSSVSIKTLQSTLSESTETSQGTKHLQSEKVQEKDDRVADQGTELKAAPLCNEVEKDTQSWNQSCTSTQFEIPNVPSAPALYPSLPTLEEGPVIQLTMQSIKNGAKGPAVLALPEQESSPPSLQPLESVAELSMKKLYPEIPVTAPEIQPFSLEQLSVWEPGGGLRAWLEGVEMYAVQFCALARQENHELTELLQNYWRCRRQLTQSHTQLHTQSSDCKSTQNRLWSFRDEQLTLQGVCADQSKVCGYHRFQQADFSQSVLAELRRLFEARSELLHQKVALHAYTALLSRLQVESYLYRLLKDWSGSQTQPCSLQPLKEAISVLFSFTRRVLDDAQFQTDIHHWLERLVAVLLHVGGSGEHLYLLCHLLCCPAGVGKWSAPFLQIQVLGSTCGVQHFMQALAILMSPTRHRAEFLGHMKPSDNQSSSGSGPESGNWTLVDEGGEEDEDPESSWLLLCEEDLISLLNQYPFQQLYSHMLGMSKQGVYEPQAYSSQKMMRLFAFASSLIEILALGLQTYNRARYRQLVKRIGHIIRMTVCYVSDHWAQYVTVTSAGGSSSHVHSLSLDKLQLEYDHLFLRAVLHVLRNKRLGIWLFMSEMPYGTLSSCMLWKVLYVMQSAETAGVETLSTARDTQSCIQSLRDPEHQVRFEQWLCEVNSSDGISLLTALAHMAIPTQHTDPVFITTITLLIYQVSYVSMSTREIYSKVGRELLAAIATAHPYVISVLLEKLRETIQTVGMMALYLCKELPLSLWLPRPEEICVIGAWLLLNPLSAVENRLACVILEGLNWGYAQDGSLALPSSLHSEVALLVAEAYQKYLTDKPYSGLISEGIKQVSYLASVLRLGVSPEASFSQWAWQLLLRLKLHRNSQNPKGAWSVPASTPPPELTHTPSMHSVLRAVKAGIPIGCYLSIAMTTVGHSLENFCTEGVGLLKSLIQSRHLKAAVHLLDKILPPTYPLSFYLLNNSQFVSCMQLFLQYDSVCPQGVTQQVTHRVAPLLTGTNYGDNVRLLNSVIQSHVVESSQPGRVGAAAVLEFWVGILTQQNLWYRDKTVLFLMDQLCCAAFTQHQEECVQKLLYQLHKDALGYHGDRGLLSSLVGWIAGNATPSFIEGQSLSAEVWFAWLVLNMEGLVEEDSQMRRCVELELLSEPNVSPEQALKKAQQRIKLPVAPSLQRLQVYRWACQALATPPDHPLLPLVWQKFLQLYLRQPGPEYGLAAGGCIGRRFFQASSQASLLGELKLRIQELSDFHHAASQALRVPPPQTPSSDSRSDETPDNPCPSYLTSPQLHTELVRLFGVFALWLDDETLQKQEVYLPSLPAQYEPHRLAQVMQRHQELWLEFLDQERLQYDEREVLSLWEKVKSEPTFLQAQNPGFIDCTSPNNAKERILSNLQKHPIPCAPPELQQLKAPVGEILTGCFTDSKAAAELLQQDLCILQDQARIAVAREAQQVAMEQELLESLPLLYKNRSEQVTMALECKGKGGQPCQGPANITVTCERVQRQEAVQTQITSLCRDVKKLQTDAMAPPPQSLAQAAVHTENFITALVNMYKAQKSPAVQHVGVSAFYQVVSFVCEDTLRHPPTRQYLSSCVEILGQVFIQHNPEECGRVLKTILEQRRLCPLISPFFTPNAAPKQLVFLYQDVVTSLHFDSADVIFMLLTKFDLPLWLNEAHPVFSERTRLLELIHGALCVCGRDPEPELLIPFHLFAKHWTWLLRHHFPDHYSDCLRLLMTSSSNQLLSPECWKVTLRVLGCLPPSRSTKSKAEQTLTSTDVPGRAVAPQASPYRSPISLSPQQVDETVQWLSDYFLRSRLGKQDLRSFGLYSAWTPYISDVVSFWEHLINHLINVQFSSCARESVGSSKIIKALQDLHSKIVNLFKPWIFPVDCDDGGNLKCYPWLETDASAAERLLGLYAQLTDALHHRFRDRLLPGQRGALWLCMMQYCESCTSPRTPEYLLYLYHTHLRSLPWKCLHPDTQLMEQLFNVERGSPKSCFLFMGEVLCEVNWISVLSDHLQTPSASATYPTLPQTWTQKESHTMLVYLLYMLVFLAKEDQLLTQQDSPLLSLLVQSTSLPWRQLDLSSYQGILGYVSTHYPPTLLLSVDCAPQLLLKSLRSAAGLHCRANEAPHIEETLKAGAYVCWCVQSLVNLEQGGSISLGSLEAQLETLLESIVTFNPPETGLEQRHMAFCSLFSDALALLNGVGVSSGEALAARVITWLDRKGRGFPILPLLTACTRCLASVRHMTRIMEACITAYFNHAEEESVGWGPVLASLQVPELTVDDFLSESHAGGSFLTLYAFILQRLNTEYTAANERRTLALINTWTSQVFPSGPGDEAKLFLWWHKALYLSAEQIQPQAGLTEVSGVVMNLLKLQTRLLQLGEERQNSGLLGAIGLGKKSPVSNRFRVVVRSLAAFLSVQVPSDNELRLQPTSDLQLSVKAQQALGLLEAMPSNKQYAEFEESVNKAVQFIRYPGHCLKDAPRLLSLLANLLYPDLRYLHIIR